MAFSEVLLEPAHKQVAHLKPGERQILFVRIGDDQHIFSPRVARQQREADNKQGQFKAM